MKKTTSIPFAAAVAAALFASIPAPAQDATGETFVPQELCEVQKILDSLPNFEGKSEEEIERILAAHPEYARKIDEAERKALEAFAAMDKDVDMATLEALLAELAAIQELQDKSEDEIRQVLAANPEVRQRVSAVGRRMAVAAGARVANEPEEHTMPVSAESALVPDDIGEVVVLPDGTTTNIIDDIYFGELDWCFGGFKGGEADRDRVLICNLEMEKKGLRFTYLQDLSAWGMNYTDYSGALACLFVLDNDGKWIGGKFEFISTSRNKRSFENIYSGYRGWDLSNVPKTTTAAFVIVSKDGKKRSNVISAIWER